MKCFMSIMCLMLLVRPSFAAPFWPLGAQSTLTYSNGTEVIITPPAGDAAFTGYHEHGGGYDIWSSFSMGVDGDVYCHGGMVYSQGGFDPDFWGGGEPVKILDLPLSPGKTWVNDYPGNGGLVFGAVVGSGTVHTAMGALDYFEVYIMGVSQYFDGTYYLNEQYGRVMLPGGATLVGAIGAVPAESQSWGTVKSLFR